MQQCFTDYCRYALHNLAKLQYDSGTIFKPSLTQYKLELLCTTLWL